MMKRNLDIKTELSAISQAVDTFPIITPFAVPKEYFETFPNRIILLAREGTLANKVKVDRTLSPLLQSIQKENPFALPEGYFQNFQLNDSKAEAKTVRMLSTRNVVRYVAAACITGLVVSLLFFSLRTNTGTQDSLAGSHAADQLDISKDAVETYLSDLENYSIDAETDDFTDNGGNSLVDLNIDTIGKMLTELSESGITQYMNLNEIKETQIILN